MIEAGFEPAIFGFEVRRLIRWAIRPTIMHDLLLTIKFIGTKIIYLFDYYFLTFYDIISLHSRFKLSSS